MGSSREEDLREDEENDDDEGPPSGWKSTYPRGQEDVKFDEEEDVDDDDDDGPPPGWHTFPSHSIHPSPTQPPSQLPYDTEMGSKHQDFEDDEDGPPPGWESMYSPHPAIPTPPTPPAVILSDIEMENKHDDDDGDDGPPPGWQSISLLQLSCTQASLVPSGIEVQNKRNLEDEDEGPPPGWESISLPLRPLSSAPTPLPPSLEVPSILTNMEVGGSQKEPEDDDEGPPPGWQSIPPQQSHPPPPQPSSMAPSGVSDMKIESKQEINGGFPHVQKSMAPPKQLSPIPTPQAPPAAQFDKAQMVCGSCRKLLSYPRGAKAVQCACCQTVNVVLEAHQVGQVKCGSCAVFLMYPYGAPSVRCSSCCHVTEIGVHNRRPPLSEQQKQARRLTLTRPIR